MIRMASQTAVYMTLVLCVVAVVGVVMSGHSGEWIKEQGNAYRDRYGLFVMCCSEECVSLLADLNLHELYEFEYNLPAWLQTSQVLYGSGVLLLSLLLLLLPSYFLCYRHCSLSMRSVVLLDLSAVLCFFLCTIVVGMRCLVGDTQTHGNSTSRHYPHSPTTLSPNMTSATMLLKPFHPSVVPPLSSPTTFPSIHCCRQLMGGIDLTLAYAYYLSLITPLALTFAAVTLWRSYQREEQTRGNEMPYDTQLSPFHPVTNLVCSTQGMLTMVPNPRSSATLPVMPRPRHQPPTSPISEVTESSSVKNLRFVKADKLEVSKHPRKDDDRGDNLPRAIVQIGKRRDYETTKVVLLHVSDEPAGC